MIMRNGRKKKYASLEHFFCFEMCDTTFIIAKKASNKITSCSITVAQYKWKMIFVHIYTYWTADNSVLTPV